MATNEEFSAIVKALNKVESAAQARAAAGAALNAAGDAYKILPRLSDEGELRNRNMLDGARVSLQDYYRSIVSQPPQASVKEGWARNRKLVERVYIVIGGIEAEASYKPQTSNLDILAQSIREAPAVFAKGAGEVVNAVGSTAGSAVGGLFSGLGIGGTLTLLIVGVVVLLVVTRGSILGFLFKGGGGG